MQKTLDITSAEEDRAGVRGVLFRRPLLELMRLKTGEINRCAYCATVRAAGVRDQVRPKAAVFGEIDPIRPSGRPL